jgi:5'-nucleotidase (lipoprotein e(P4) family)
MTRFSPRRSIPLILVISSLLPLGWSLLPSEPHQDTNRTEHTVLAINWYQTAAEFRALSYQAYNVGRIMLDQELKKRSTKKRAVVVDVDETVLDNSPHAARLVFENRGYPHLWDEWVNAAKAEALPGAVEFLRYAVSNGVDVFYVSNRRVDQIKVTAKNLAACGFPQAVPSHMLFKERESTKEPRRQTILKTHNIILLLGDNLNDFADVFEGKNVQERAEAVDKLKEEFGRRFIVLPNPIYGDWEGALYDYNYRLSAVEKDQRRKQALRSFQ